MLSKQDQLGWQIAFALANIPQETWTYNLNNNTNKEKQQEQSGLFFIQGILVLWFPPPGRLFFIIPDTLLYLRRFVVQVLMHNGWGLTRSSALWEDGELAGVCHRCWLLLIELGHPWDGGYEAFSMLKHCTVSWLVLSPKWVICIVSTIQRCTFTNFNFPVFLVHLKSPWWEKQL